MTSNNQYPTDLAKTMEEEDEDEARINIPLQTLPPSQPWEPAHHSDSEESFMDSESVEDGPITGVSDHELGFRSTYFTFCMDNNMLPGTVINLIKNCLKTK